MDNLYNDSNNFNLTNALQLLLVANAERDSLNNLMVKRSALKTLIAPLFLLAALGVILYFIISNDASLMYLIYVAAPLGLVLFVLLFINAAKGTYVIKVSNIEITKKYLFKRKISINYPYIESVKILMPRTDNAGSYSEPALSFMKMSLVIKSSKAVVIVPVFIKGFVEFYKVFKENFPDGSKNVLKVISQIFMKFGIDLENGMVSNQNPNHENFDEQSPFEGF